MDKMQEEFEVWADGQGYATDKYEELDLSCKYKQLAGTYVIPGARLMFEAWQASRAALRVDATILCDSRLHCKLFLRDTGRKKAPIRSRLFLSVLPCTQPRLLDSPRGGIALAHAAPQGPLQPQCQPSPQAPL